MKYRFEEMRPLRWVLGVVFFVFFWGVAWGASPTASITVSGGPFCLGDVVTINIIGSDHICSIVSCTIAGAPVTPSFTPNSSATNTASFTIPLNLTNPNPTISIDVAIENNCAGNGAQNANATASIQVTLPPQIQYLQPFCWSGNSTTTPIGFTPGEITFSVPGGFPGIHTSYGTVLGANYQTGFPNPITVHWQHNTCPSYAQNITIAAPAPTQATLSYGVPQNFYCRNTIPNLLNATTSPNNNGTFAVTPTTTASFFSTTDGHIQFNQASIAGTYQISYYYPGNPCILSDTISILITDDTCRFHYPNSVLCKGTGFSSPIFDFRSISAALGTFSSPNPQFASAIDINTGAIDLNNLPIVSVPTTYDVTYNPSSSCNNSLYYSTNQITVLPPGNASFTLSDSILCTDQNTITASPSTNTYSSPNVGITNAGVIPSSQPNANSGMYWVFHSIAITPTSCAAVDSQKLRVIVPTQVDFYYGSSNSVDSADFCPNGGRILPIFVNGQTSTGAFQLISGPLGATINTTTGEVDTAGAAGRYYIEYSTQGRCPTTDHFIVNLLSPTSSAFHYAVDSVCKDGDTLHATITGMTGGTFYSQYLQVANDGTVDPVASAPPSGNYDVTYAVISPCSSSSTSQITLIARDQADFYYGTQQSHVPPTLYCSTQQYFQASPGSNFSSGGYFSQVGGGISSLTLDSSIGRVDIMPGDTGLYTIRYITRGFCKDTSDFQVNILDAPSADFEYDQLDYCPSAGLVLPTVSSHLGVFTVNPSSGLSIDNVTGQVNAGGSTPGIYMLDHDVQIGTHCHDSHRDSIKINVVDIDTHIQADTTKYCEGELITVSILGSTDTSGNWTLTPYNLPLQSRNGTQVTFSAVPDLQQRPLVIQYKDYGDCGETSSDTILIDAPTQSDLDYPDGREGLNKYCMNENLLLPANTNGLAGYFLTDSTSPSISANGTIDIDATGAGDFQVTFHPTGFCQLDDVYNLIIFEAPDSLQLNILPTYICEGDTVTVQAGTTNLHHYFYLGDSLPFSGSSIRLDTVDDGDDIRVKFINQFGCFAEKTEVLQVHPYPHLTVHPSDGTTYLTNNRVAIYVASDAPETHFYWSTDLDSQSTSSPTFGIDSITNAPDSIFVPIIPRVNSGTSILKMNFEVYGEAFGCSDSLHHRHYTIIPNAEPPIFIPGAFSPDHEDEINSTWKITWPTDVPNNYGDYKIEVFNRSGGVVLARQSLSQVAYIWNGDGLPDGVYKYILRDPAGNFVRHGGVTIKR